MARKKETGTPTERLVAYYRYSGGSGQTEQSIEGQRRDCKAWAKAHGLTIEYEYIDRHISGKTDNRKQFQRMMEDSDKHAFTALICWKTDRLARNRYDSAIYKNRLRKNGVKIYYAAESSVDGPEGIILEGLMESLAEYYSAELSQKLRRGLRESALKCHTLGGYRMLGLTSNKNHEYVIKEDEAPTVRYIFEQYAAGKPAAAIVADLNAKGLRTSTGGTFNKNSIIRIITNERYLGTYVSKAHGVHVENAFPAIIDRALWNKVQEKLKFNRARRTPRAGRARYMLSGKLYCQLCGKPMHGDCGTGNGGKYFYYICSQRTTHKCEKASIGRDFLENLVVSATADHILAPGKLEEIADRVVSIQLADQDRENPEKDMLESELADVFRKQEHIMDAIEEGSGSARLSARLHELEERESDLRSQLAALREPVAAPVFDRDQLIFMLSQFRRDPDEQDDDYKQRIIDTFIHAVYITDETAFVQFNLTDRTNEESTTLESVMLDLLHGETDDKNPSDSGTFSRFDRGTFGGDGGNRTRVRKPVTGAFYECSGSFDIPSAHRRTAGFAHQ